MMYSNKFNKLTQKHNFQLPIHAAARMNEITVQRKMHKKGPRAG